VAHSSASYIPPSEPCRAELSQQHGLCIHILISLTPLSAAMRHLLGEVCGISEDDHVSDHYHFSSKAPH